MKTRGTRSRSAASPSSDPATGAARWRMLSMAGGVPLHEVIVCAARGARRFVAGARSAAYYPRTVPNSRPMSSGFACRMPPLLR